MLTKGDDYPLHQRPEPVATAGSDRNFYDRYFFNGYNRDGDLFFASAFGVYPHLGIMDAALSVSLPERQLSIFASRQMADGERMDTAVDPIAVEVIEPLRELRLVLAANDGPLAADLVMRGRAPPIEEPRFTHRVGTRTVMDATRLTQAVMWEGWIEVESERHDVSAWWGTRDRSWGIRPVGAPDAQPPGEAPQFYWLWSPLNFRHHALFFHTNDDAQGRPWNRAARLVDLNSGRETELALAPHLGFKPGSRNAASARLEGEGVRVDLELGRNFHMTGIGYGHPARGHGMYQGAHNVAHEELRLCDADLGAPIFNHVQALAAATLRLPDGGEHKGRGVLEQLFIGPHEPSGFKKLFDLA